MIASIYNDVHSLENIQFLLKYANTVLPQNPCLTDCGEIVYAKILELQETLTAKRLVAIQAVTEAMSQLYPEQLPDTVQQKAITVCTTFKTDLFATKRELMMLNQVALNPLEVFPLDFIALVPAEVAVKARAAFQRKG
eukprot:CAMPEP_0119053778 /NCGR_PEP_ID=MMETSP1177-20130426/74647_1 /TAXON_ID=2985 /ORGANISM="Ochromonas sp, Strain CCMP1899" /LENGTH=137 /DNA_ID=CAMNT_0007033827 /DNA_START=943 /DNA_END=1356 /DNA_ORIENTATION=+